MAARKIIKKYEVGLMTMLNKEDEIIDRFGLKPAIDHREIIQSLLIDETNNSSSEDNEYLKTLCIMLFSLGRAEDSLLIWKAKQKNFDASCYIDVQLLCGAGFENTVEFLKTINDESVSQQIEYLEKCKGTDFVDFNKETIIENYRQYYGI
ncbi:hypothetical protein PCCS19_02420 [Paenibacillus sp. CCS19]|uniref:hypothetical protein n=1 Tax=Paenibacillus sp. CCS19 TaxID=3158387 RepID=UPI002562B703|nr:hypothetical protein [Paenibacillus cellulosilyticus]GMK37189.1 hypothetical protein PCCS19_02420 [Paenibacillus cellulosilyticus]